MIAVGIEASDPHPHTTVPNSLMNGFGATLNVMISLSGHIAFFGFQSELADPKDFTKALFLLQGFDVTFYLIVSIVIYCYAGEHVRSPALLSTSPTVAKVAFGLAIGTIVIAGVVLGHTNVKYVYVRIFRGTRHLKSNSVVSNGVWILLSLVAWTLAWIIAEAIPVFNDMLGLLASAFSCWFSFGFEALFYFSMHKGNLFKGQGRILLTLLNGFIIVLTLVTVSTNFVSYTVSTVDL